MIEVSLLVKVLSEVIFRYYYTFFQSGIQHFIVLKNCVFPHFSGLIEGFVEEVPLA